MTDNTKMREAVLKILASYKQEMERYGYYSSNPGVSVDDFEEIADEIVAWQAARTLPEVITTAKMYHEVAQRLYALLDDIDTAGDIAKGDDALYRKIVERTQSKKGTFVIYCDGQTVRLVDDAMLAAAPEVNK